MQTWLDLSHLCICTGSHGEVQRIGIEVAIDMSDPCTGSAGAVGNAVKLEVSHPPPDSLSPSFCFRTLQISHEVKRVLCLKRSMSCHLLLYTSLKVAYLMLGTGLTRTRL